MGKIPYLPQTLTTLFHLSRAAGPLQQTLTPFLYPCLVASPSIRNGTPCPPGLFRHSRHSSSSASPGASIAIESDSDTYRVPRHHKEYNEIPFTDIITLNLQAGNGGHGCISFLRDKFIDRGPPNGGDGGRGGSVYIQAIYGENTSLHKLARQGVIQAGSGRNGQGKSKDGEWGEDVILRVPVGTVVREIGRYDPEEELRKYDEVAFTGGDDLAHSEMYHGSDNKWIHYPLSESENIRSPKFQAAKYPMQHHLSSSRVLRHTHPLPVNLDLSKPTPTPILLIPGAPGGLGNPNFITQKTRAPKFATRGGDGCRMKISLELKILADVGLVGLPNAGKSSFLRSITRRKAKVGEWAFTTLSPNIGTVQLHPSQSRPQEMDLNGPRERFTIADIPGLIADAHLDKGLGHGFLRHVERAKILAFVVDLGRPDPLGDLELLWKEVKAYEEGWGDELMLHKLGLRGMIGEMAGNKQIHPELPLHDEEAELLGNQIRRQSWDASSSKIHIHNSMQTLQDKGDEELVFWGGSQEVLPKYSASPNSLNPAGSRSHPHYLGKKKISAKPWFLIANKADLPGTEKKFLELRQHLQALGTKRGQEIAVVPLSAMKGEGVEGAVQVMTGLLDTLDSPNRVAPRID